jgi:hypothetical protein
MRDPTKRTVNVWDKPHEIAVYQKSKSVWVAVGEYMCERVEVNGRTESQTNEALLASEVPKLLRKLEMEFRVLLAVQGESRNIADERRSQ